MNKKQFAFERNINGYEANAGCDYLKQQKGNIKYAKRNCEGRAWAGSDCNKQTGDDCGFPIDCLTLCSN